MCKLWFLLGIFIQSLVPKLCLRKQRGGLTQRAFTLSPDGARGHQSPVRAAHPKRPAARAASYGSSRAGARAVHPTNAVQSLSVGYQMKDSTPKGMPVLALI